MDIRLRVFTIPSIENYVITRLVVARAVLHPALRLKDFNTVTVDYIFSVDSVDSVDSVESVNSVDSVDSIDSVESVYSIGSFGSVYSNDYVESVVSVE